MHVVESWCNTCFCFSVISGLRCPFYLLPCGPVGREALSLVLAPDFTEISRIILTCYLRDKSCCPPFSNKKMEVHRDLFKQGHTTRSLQSTDVNFRLLTDNVVFPTHGLAFHLQLSIPQRVKV